MFKVCANGPDFCCRRVRFHRVLGFHLGRQILATMRNTLCYLGIASVFISITGAAICLLTFRVQSSLSFAGIRPSDKEYFTSSVIKCKDGTGSFTRDRLNDNYCDCVDGTDEPGTSACAGGMFYCSNIGSVPQLLFSSRINDQICDCCDGSDEYGTGGILCPNTCPLGDNLDAKNGLPFKEFVPSIQGLKIIITLQLILLSLGVMVLVVRTHLHYKI